MNISSKFAFLPIFICLFITVTPVVIISLTGMPAGFSIFGFGFWFCFIIYFWLTEFRTRAHSVEILKDNIVLREYFGLGRRKEINLKDIEGFIRSTQPGKMKDYEFLFLLKKGKRVVAISEFYHRNYSALRSQVENKIPDLGRQKYKFLPEYKEMFR